MASLTQVIWRATLTVGILPRDWWWVGLEEGLEED
jgi:hypothetical protein